MHSHAETPWIDKAIPTWFPVCHLAYPCELVENSIILLALAIHVHNYIFYILISLHV